MSTCKHENKQEDGYFNCWYCNDCNEYVEYEKAMKIGDKVRHNETGWDGFIEEIDDYKVYWCRYKDRVICCSDYDELTVIKEEKQMKETFTGLEAIEKMVDGEWIIREGMNIEEANAFSIADNKLRRMNGGATYQTEQSMNYFFDNTFEVYTPQPQFEVGKYYVVTSLGRDYVGKIEEIEGGELWAKWNEYKESKFFSISVIAEEMTWREATPEEIKQYERTRKFIDNGREVNEFRVGDIVATPSGKWHEVTDKSIVKDVIQGVTINEGIAKMLKVDKLTLVVPTEVIL